MAIFENPLPNEIISSVASATKAGAIKGLASQPGVVQQLQQAGGINVRGASKALAKNVPVTIEEIEQNLSIQENIPEAQFLDSQMWKLSITVTNYSPPVKPVFIPGNYIHELVLEHNVLDPCFWKGSMVVTSNRFGILEGEDPDDNVNLEMLFRGDGKDEILVEIKPLFGGEVELPQETWDIKSEFIVYDTEDIPWKGETGTAKKIYFWHKSYNLMLEKNPVFSTAFYSLQKDITKATNEQRMLPVGDAIKKLFIQSGLESYIDQEEWDDGNLSSKIFHTSSAAGNVLDSLHEMLPYFVSKNGDPGILYFHRGKNKFQLLSIKKFFENAGITDPGKYYYETFMVGSADAGEINTNITPNKTPVQSGSKYDYAIMMKKYNVIQDNSYVLTEAGGADSLESMVSTMQHSYNHKNKRFNVYYKDSEIKSYKAYFKKTYTDKLTPGSKGSPLITLNTAKKTQQRVKQRFNESISTGIETIKFLGRNYLTLSTLYLNLGISFRVQGSTHRHAGRFIGLEKNKNSDNKYDYRLLGQWFVTSVITRWQENQLYNEITANKVSSFEDLNFNEDA